MLRFSEITKQGYKMKSIAVKRRQSVHEKTDGGKS